MLTYVHVPYIHRWVFKFVFDVCFIRERAEKRTIIIKHTYFMAVSIKIWKNKSTLLNILRKKVVVCALQKRPLCAAPL